MKNFWATLPKPFFALAPMEDVTDAAFRRLVAWYGKPHVMFTEFTSADGLVLADANGQRQLRKKLQFSDNERPIVAQLFTADPERMEKASHIVTELGFDGVDINMGCPDRAVEQSGCGAALMKDPTRARKLIRATKRSGFPVSIKTRIGYNNDELETWLPALLSEEPAAITIHARTRKEMSDVPAHWDAVARAVDIRNSYKSRTLIIGNGDAESISDARAKAHASRCDGVMLGRAAYGNPWLCADRAEPPTPEEKIKALNEHLELFDDLLSDTTNYAVMKKHFKAYVSDWRGAKEFRAELMGTRSVQEGKEILEDIRRF